MSRDRVPWWVATLLALASAIVAGVVAAVRGDWISVAAFVVFALYAAYVGEDERRS